jgi:hypothetical protein
MDDLLKFSRLVVATVRYVQPPCGPIKQSLLVRRAAGHLEFDAIPYDWRINADAGGERCLPARDLPLANGDLLNYRFSILLPNNVRTVGQVAMLRMF